MAYKNNWATGDLIDATAFQELVNSAVYSFTNLSTITSTISSPIDGQIAFAQDTEIYYRYDADSTSWVALFSGLGDITAVNTASGSGLQGGGASGSLNLSLDIAGATSGTVAGADEILIADVSDSNNLKKVTAQTIGDLASVTALTTNVTVKVADDGSGSQNVFYLLSGSDTGSGTKTPALDVYFGMKIKFDLSDSSLSGHNFKFSTTKDGTNNSGSEFTTNVTSSGTAGSSGAFVQLEITPETLGTATTSGSTTSVLYYYCSNHSGMGAEGKLSLYPNASAGGVSLGLVLALG